MYKVKSWRHVPPSPPFEWLNYDECISAPIPATRFLDGLSYIGDEFVGCFIQETSEGILMLDCTCNTEHHVEVIKKSFGDLGLKLEDVKYILISHGHFDHYGKCEVLRELSGAKILMSEIDYHLAKTPGITPRPPMACEPDRFISEGDIITLGDTSINIFHTPGHTPGCLSFIFNVADEGKPHMAALRGGSSATRISAKECEEFIESSERFGKLSNKFNVDVILSPHPYYDNTKEKLALIRNISSAGVPNPFILGREGCSMLENHMTQLGIDALRNIKAKENI